MFLFIIQKKIVPWYTAKNVFSADARPFPVNIFLVVKNTPDGKRHISRTELVIS